MPRNPEMERKYQRAYYEKNKDRMRERRKKWAKENSGLIAQRRRERIEADLSGEWKARQAETVRNWQKNNPEKMKAAQLRKRLRVYGLSIGEYEARIRAQGSSCAICGTVTERLCLDHCHKTGKLRGLLCDTCNKALGMLGDDAEGIRRALDYLNGCQIGTC